MAAFHGEVERAVSKQLVTAESEDETESVYIDNYSDERGNETKTRFVEMHGQISGLQFVETKLKPLVPILAAHNRILARLRIWNADLQSNQHISNQLA